MFAKRSQAFASVRAGSDMPERRKRRKSSRNAELSLLFTFCLTKVSTVTGIGGVVVAKPRTVVTFGLAAGERKGERREEKRGMRGEKRGERREEKRRVDRRKERGERRQERRAEGRERRGRG